ncbi:MAG TPA: hypothetical protein PK867_06920 [Pirellulales bacterium]|nr:hypothetical protein [Pirellulales bacterium]
MTKEQLQALTQNQLKEAKKLQVQAENIMRRLRGDEVESDKEVEGDLDAVPLRFHAEHAPPPDQVAAIIRNLLDLVNEDQPPTTAAQTGS